MAGIRKGRAYALGSLVPVDGRVLAGRGRWRWWDGGARGGDAAGVGVRGAFVCLVLGTRTRGVGARAYLPTLLGLACIGRGICFWVGS